MADEAREFWDAFEKETGEKVEARSLGEWFERDGDRGLWGLLILTDKAFRFKHMPSDNWVSSLFRRADKAPKREPVEIRIAREDLVSMLAPKGGFFAKLIGPAFPRFTVTGRGEEGEKSYLFSVDPASDLVAALGRALAPRPEQATAEKG
jgi:hypothetical protein